MGYSYDIYYPFAKFFVKAMVCLADIGAKFGNGNHIWKTHVSFYQVVGSLSAMYLSDIVPFGHCYNKKDSLGKREFVSGLNCVS